MRTQFGINRVHQQLSCCKNVEPYGVASPPYIELKFYGIYSGGKPNLYPLIKKSDKSQCKKNSKRLTNQHVFFHSKPMEESVILNVQYTG